MSSRTPIEYRKTATIKAVQFTQEWIDGHIFDGEPLPDGVRFSGASYHRERREIHSATFIIDTLEGKLTVSPGDWIATGVKGEHWAIKPDVFAASYEPSDAQSVRPDGGEDPNPTANSGES